MGDRAIFVDDSNETRLSGELAFPESTPGDVLTVQSDGSIAAAAGGGSITVPTTITASGNPNPVLTVDNTDAGGSTAFEVLNEIPTAILSVGTGAAATSDQVVIAAPTSIAPSNAYAGFDSLVVSDASGTTLLRVTDPGELGFYGKTPVVQPVVPLTVPVVQDVIDALVALGLVAQHD